MIETKCYNMKAQILKLIITKYADGNMAVLAECVIDDTDDPMNGQPETNSLSVNLTDLQSPGLLSCDLPKGDFYAKNYSENEWLFNALLKEGWIELTGIITRSGFVELPACKITEKAITEAPYTEIK